MIIRIFGIVAAAALLLAGCGQKDAIRYDGKTVVASGWKGGGDEPLESVLRVYASTDPEAPPVAGTYDQRGSKIVFKPSFPPSPSVTLRVTYRQPDGSLATAIFPGKGAPVVAASTRVTAVYPTADAWPANTLKFYIHFSAPMRQGEAWRHIQLVDEQGRAIEKPFVEIDQELWNPSGDRLTVLFDPGRIKRGLTDHDAVGAPLKPGHRYTLKIDPQWKDAAGAPLAQAFDRSITIGPEVRAPVDPLTWKYVRPDPDRSEPWHEFAIVFDFPRPMDNALAQTAITLRRDGRPVPGKVRLAENETRWTFVPEQRLKPGAYQLHVEGILEDIAGNRVGRRFDVDTLDKAQTIPPPASVDIPIEVK